MITFGIVFLRIRQFYTSVFRGFFPACHMHTEDKCTIEHVIEGRILSLKQNNM